MRRRWVIFAALFSGLALAVPTYSDQKKKTDAEKTEKIEPKKEPAAPAGMTDADLEARLKKLGYEPKLIKGPTSDTFEVRFTRDNWIQVFQVGLVNGGKQLAIFSTLGELKPADKLAAADLEKLLRKNDEIGPTLFAVTKYRQLILARIVSTQDITPAQVRQRIDDFTTNIVKTAPLWKAVTK